VRHPRPLRDWLRPGLRGPLPRAAQHLFVGLNPLTAGVLRTRAELPTRWWRLSRSRPAHLARPEARGPGGRLIVKPDDVLLQRVAAGVAGRVAEHLGRLHALVTNSLLGQ